MYSNSKESGAGKEGGGSEGAGKAFCFVDLKEAAVKQVNNNYSRINLYVES